MKIMTLDELKDIGFALINVGTEVKPVPASFIAIHKYVARSQIEIESFYEGTAIPNVQDKEVILDNIEKGGVFVLDLHDVESIAANLEETNCSKIDLARLTARLLIWKEMTFMS